MSAKKTILSIFLIFAMLFAAANVFAHQNPAVDLQPEWSTPGGMEDYTVEVCNEDLDDDETVHAIDEVRIYQNPDYSGFSCDQKTGWTLIEVSNFYDPELGYVDMCWYSTNPTYSINEGECTDFTFDADVPASVDDCEVFTWKFETRDEHPDSGTYISVYDTTKVDDNPPVTFKDYGNPFIEGFEGSYPHFATSDTPITLTASEILDCDIGVDKTWYITMLVDDSYCESELACNALCINPYDESCKNTQEMINYKQDECEESLGEYSTWEECVQEEVHRCCDSEWHIDCMYIDGQGWADTMCDITCSIDDGSYGQSDDYDEKWQLYTEPFTIPEDSCHMMQFFSVDHLGNLEPMNHQCVFVDNQEPIGIKTIQEPKIPLYTENFEEHIVMDSSSESPEVMVHRTFAGGKMIWDFELEDQQDPNCDYGHTEFGLAIGFSEDKAEFQLGTGQNQGAGSPPVYQVCDGGPDATFGCWAGGSGPTHDLPEGMVVDNPGGDGEPGYGDRVFRVEIPIEYLNNGEFYWALSAYGGQNYGGCKSGYQDYPDSWDKWSSEGLYADASLNVMDWWLGKDATITLDCADQDPHPVGDETVCFRIGFDETPFDLTAEYCDQSLDDGWCCVEGPYDITFDEDSEHTLEYYCYDALGNENELDVEIFKVDLTPPTFEKHMLGVQGEDYMGDCPPVPGSDDICYVADNDKGGINMTVVDEGTCAVDDVECYYEVTWIKEGQENEVVGSGTFSDYAEYYFQEDSTHEVYVKCKDALGNTVEDTETFLVDSTPPVTLKTYGEPTFVGYDNDFEYRWITSDTLIELNATDNKVGVKNVSYRVTLLSECAEDACHEACDFSGKGDYTTVSGDNAGFNIPEDSCHLIEYYSVDKLGNTEDMHSQCVFVDNQAPEVFKNVGEPKIPYDVDFGDGGYACSADLQNPGFETGDLTGWNLDSAPDFVGVVSADSYTTPLQGNYMLQLGNMGDSQPTGNNQVSQVFVVTQPTLRFSYNIFTVDYTGYNHFHYVVKRVSDGAVIAQFSQGAWGSGSELKTTGWQNVEIDLSGYIGEEVKIEIACGGTSDSSLPTWAYVDCSGQPSSWYVSIDTPITLDCSDAEPHPVGYETLFWRYSQHEGGFDSTPTYSEWFNASSDEFPVDVHFEEDCYHDLEYYCVDKLGNEGEHHTQYYAVDAKPPMIDTEVVGPQIACSESSEPVAESCDGWACLTSDGDGQDHKDFEATVRYGQNNPETGGWELAIKNPDAAEEVYGHYGWTSGQAVPFELSYDADTGLVTLTVGSGEAEESITYMYDAGKAFEYIAVVGKGKEAGNLDTFVSGIMVNGEAVPDVDADDQYAGARIFLPDTYQADGFVVNGMVTLSWGTAPGGSGAEIPGFQIFAMETHIPMECTMIDGITEIEVYAEDQEPHPVGGVMCDWWYYVEETGADGEMEDVEAPFTINFPEESTHILTIECWDQFGNTATHMEKFIVDKTPPTIFKDYEGPLFELDNGTHWINLDTVVEISVEDTGMHKTGLAETKYRVAVVDDMYCWNIQLCDDASAGDAGWTTFEDPAYGEFQMQEESCHLIEVMAKDNVDKTSLHKQCVFVDATPPTPNKTVQEPKSLWDGADAYFYDLEGKCWADGEGGIDCWKVTMNTPISLECTDEGDHPVDHERVCFNVELDAKDKTELYCDYYDGQMNEEDGYCCVDTEISSFRFHEESEHNLKYYCVDALGNEGVVDDEKFKVTGTNFTIPLYMKWNLISVPVVLLDDDPAEVFKDIEDLDSVWSYDSVNGVWEVWSPGAPSSLDKIEPGWGYWVLMHDDDNLLIGGALMDPATVPPARPLVPGWNLIGYYGTEWQSYGDGGLFGNTAYCALASLVDTTLGHPRWSSLWGYENDGTNSAWLPINLWTTVYAGKGYWVELDVDENYVPSTTCPLYGPGPIGPGPLVN